MFPVSKDSKEETQYRMASRFFALLSFFSVVGYLGTLFLRKGAIIALKKQEKQGVIAGNQNLLKKITLAFASWAVPLWLILRVKSALQMQREARRRRRFWSGAGLLILWRLYRKRRKK